MNNATFSETDQDFQIHCQEAGVAPSKRQASKWRSGKGIASKAGRAVAAKRVVDACEADLSEAKSVFITLLKKRDGNPADRRGIRQAINAVRAKEVVLTRAKDAHGLETLALRRRRGVE